MIALLTNKWALIGAGVLILIVLGLQFGGTVKGWLTHRAIDQAQAEAEQVKIELAVAQANIAAMSQQIVSLRKQADAAVAKARESEARAAKWQAEADRLGGTVARLEADRKQLPPVRTLQEAQVELRRLGYDLPLVRR